MFTTNVVIVLFHVTGYFSYMRQNSSIITNNIESIDDDGIVYYVFYYVIKIAKLRIEEASTLYNITINVIVVL